MSVLLQEAVATIYKKTFMIVSDLECNKEVDW